MARAYVYDMVDTWNAGATTFTAIKMNVTDTASAAGSLLMDLQVGGVSRFSVSKGGGVAIGNTFFTVNSAAALGYNGSGTISVAATGNFSFGSSGLNSPDLFLFRDAANTLAQRNGTNAQTFRIYNTYTDASNYERGGLTWSGNILTLGTAAAGTGAARAIEINAGAGLYINLNVGGVSKFGIGGSNNISYSTLTFSPDNTYDIGASGANRPRNLYMASWIRMATTTVAALPAAATAGAGARMFVTDALAPVFGSAVAGGGAVTVPVYSTGTAWNVG